MIFVQDDGSITSTATCSPLPPKGVLLAALWAWACSEAMIALPRQLTNGVTGSHDRYAHTVVCCAREIMCGFAQKEAE